MAIEVAERHASLLAALREEMGDGVGERFAAAAQQLASDFGEVTATAVEAAYEAIREENRAGGHAEFIRSPREELPSLYRPGHMRRRLDQLIETNRRYGHPFGLAVFDTSGPDTKESVDGEMALAVVSAALRDSIRIVDEAFRLEEEAICVLAPNLRTVEGMQMCERLLVPARRARAGGGPADRGDGGRRRLPRPRRRRRPAPPQSRRGDVAGAGGGPAGGRRRPAKHLKIPCKIANGFGKYADN